MTDLPDESSGNLIRSSRWNSLLDKIEDAEDTDVRIRGRYSSWGTTIVLTHASFATIYTPAFTGTLRGRTLSVGTTVALTKASFQDAAIGTLTVQGGTARARIFSAGTVVGLTSGSFGTLVQGNVRGRIITAGTFVGLTTGSFLSLTARTSRFELFDEFWGSSLDTKWSTTLTDGGTISVNTGGGNGNGQLLFATSTTSGSDARLHTGSVRTINRTSLAVFEARIFPNVATQIRYNVGLVESDHDPTGAPAGTNDHAVFRVVAGASAASTLCSTSDNTTQSASNTIDNISGDWVKYRIELDAAEVRFYINGILRVTKVTNLPDASTNLMPFIGLDVPLSTTTRQLNVDYIYVSQVRN